ncbi:sulfur carrier protein ThiS [Paracoccus contaminans]|uniref:Thiamine biosynthesis protein ThiS n=1 Tax=Paracoccus contaminans TaxID=1945662 RepID=A0A1W6CZ73_9RHOB|nr:sulfur carrier protein ThiS [Paracoccus contaminans]ARJ70152.1 thiamine biosynthesis protein ThiS [Paracoccus contaminans]
MKLTINGERREIEAATVAEALAAEGLAEARVATALNGAFVPAAARAGTALSPGDALEIVAPMQGG